MNAELTVAELWARMSPASRDLSCRAARVAEALGQPVFLVGGSVRDLLLGSDPTDLDLVTEGDAQALAEALALDLGGAARQPSQFLTALVELPDGRRVDVATARQETYPEPAKLPVVEPASIAADLRRRDFSINAMALRLGEARADELVDPHGGCADLAAGVVRVLHDLSFIDDPTRLIRAARFATRLGFVLEPHTRALVAEAARASVLDRVSGTRVRDEVVKLLGEPNPGAVLVCLADLGIERQVFPGLRLGGVLHRWLAEAPVALAALRCARVGEPAKCARTWPYLLAVLALRGDAPALVERLDLDGEAAGIVLSAHEAVGAPLPRILARHRSVSPVCLDRALSGADLARLLVYWLRSGPSGRRRTERYVASVQLGSADLDGHDLQAAGVSPGPAIGVGLQAARDAKLSGLAFDEQLQAALSAVAAWRRP